MIAYIPDDNGLFPVHMAAIAGNVNVICEVMKVCRNHSELLDNKCRNILHYAVEHKKMMLVRHICKNTKCLRMMNARDNEGNTPLHLAVKHGWVIILAFLMGNPIVNFNIMNNGGLTPLDVALGIHSEEILSSFMNACIITCLTICEASGSPCHPDRNLPDVPCLEPKKQSSSYAYVSWNIIFLSAFVATSSLASALNLPNGCVAEGKNAGNKSASRIGGRIGCWVFMIANTMSFFLSTIIPIILFVFARLTRYRRFYLILSAGLVFGAFLLMVTGIVTAVGLKLYPDSNWDECILLWLVSNYLSLPVCQRIAMRLWTRRHQWIDISKMVALAVILSFVTPNFIMPMQSIIKSALPGGDEVIVVTHPT